MNDEKAYIQAEAAKALGKIRDISATDALLKKLKNTKEKIIIEEINNALEKIEADAKRIIKTDTKIAEKALTEIKKKMDSAEN